LLPGGLGTIFQIPFVWWAASSSRAACLHFSASGDCIASEKLRDSSESEVDIAISCARSPSSDSSSSLSSSCAAESFHHSLGFLLLHLGSLAPIPIGVVGLVGGSGEGERDGAGINGGE